MRKKLKIFLFAIILIFNSFAFTPSAKAISWPDLIAATYKQAIEVIWEQIQAALVAALKQEAINLINDTVNNLISGTTQAGSMFINDWEDYLFKSPQKEAGAYMNDFFTITTRGKSSGNFQSACGGASFSEWRAAGAKEQIKASLEIDLTSMQSDFEEWACDATEMFDSGSWEAYNAFMQPNNNPIAYALMTESIYEEKARERREEAAAKAQAYQGFKATEDGNGIVLSPGSIIKDITSSANTTDNEMLANAKDVGEVIGLTVGKIASKVIKQGIGNARKNAQNQINEGICDASQGLRDELKNLTPNGSLPGSIGIGSLGDSSSESSSCIIQ